MNNQLQKLIELQAIDREILEFDGILTAVPGQIKSGQADMDAITKELEEARAVIADMKKSTKQLEADVQTENDHMAQNQDQIDSGQNQQRVHRDFDGSGIGEGKSFRL